MSSIGSVHGPTYKYIPSHDCAMRLNTWRTRNYLSLPTYVGLWVKITSEIKGISTVSIRGLYNVNK
jgi:hypothetical protein